MEEPMESTSWANSTSSKSEKTGRWKKAQLRRSPTFTLIWSKATTRNLHGRKGAEWWKLEDFWATCFGFLWVWNKLMTPTLTLTWPTMSGEDMKSSWTFTRQWFDLVLRWGNDLIWNKNLLLQNFLFAYVWKNKSRKYVLHFIVKSNNFNKFEFTKKMN